MIDNTVNKILVYKAKALKTSPEYSRYIDEVLKELGISDPKEAFMIGAVDAMLNGAAYSMNHKGHWKRCVLKETVKR